MTFDLDTLFVGRAHIHLAETESTNSYAAYLLNSDEAIEGTVVTTDFQSGGRGQIGRSWYGSSGLNVMCSVVLKPKFLLPRDQFELSIAICCAVQKTIARLSPNEDTAVKWPNDVYIGDNKVAGILIQNTIAGSTISDTIVGIGINVNEEVFPTHIPNPTSLRMVNGTPYSLDVVYANLFRDIEQYYLKLKSGDRDGLRAEYHQHLYRCDQPAEFGLAEGGQLTGIIQHVDEQGKLVMLVNGEERKYAFREVSFL